MLIQYYRKNVYGMNLIYINGRIAHEAIQTLTKTLTVSEKQLESLRLLGHRTEEILEKDANYA